MLYTEEEIISWKC